MHGKDAKMLACGYIMSHKTFFLAGCSQRPFLYGVNGHAGEAPRQESEVKKPQVKC